MQVIPNKSMNQRVSPKPNKVKQGVISGKNIVI